jgi:hypothetical protein
MFLAIERADPVTILYTAPTEEKIWSELAIEVDRRLGEPDGTVDPNDRERICTMMYDLLILKTTHTTAKVVFES